MPGLIERMFNFELEEEVLEREVFAVQDRMPLVFNYMDLFFQIHPSSTEESYKKAAKMMQELCKYYDKKACLNLKHTEIIIDVFRFCIRKDQVLSKYLERRTASRETGESKSDRTHIEPETSSVEVDTRSKLDILSNKYVFINKFERTLDELQGDGQDLLDEIL